MIEMSPVLAEGISNLQKWRKRYSQEEYSYKVVLNIFYRRYTMQMMWAEMMNLINKAGLDTFENVFSLIRSLYSKTSIKVLPKLEDFLRDEPSKFVGGICYEDFKDVIKRASAGIESSREELEFSYLFYLISDEVTLVWAALCSIGFSPVDAITEISGYTMDPLDSNDYTTITECLGQFYTALFLRDRYTPLP